MGYIYIQQNTTQPLKKIEIMPFVASNKDGPRDFHTKKSQKEKDKYAMTAHVESKIEYK